MSGMKLGNLYVFSIFINSIFINTIFINIRQFLCFLDWETETQSLSKFPWDIQVIQ